MLKTLYLAGGCFWGTQKYFDLLRGVVSTEVGYANGGTTAPTYEDVKHGSGHAETVKVTFDDSVLPTETLLAHYFLTVDPVSVDRQGGDAGHQYRTGVYYDDESLLPAIRASFAKTEAEIGAKPATELLPLENFFPAEEYHQKYLEKNPGGYCHLPAVLFEKAKSSLPFSREKE